MALPKVISQVQTFAQTNTPKVLYLGTPSYDREDIFNIQTKGFQEINSPIMKMDLSEVPMSRLKNPYHQSKPLPTEEEMRQQVEEADVIMVSGGNTLYAMKRWEEIGMADVLKDASKMENGPVFCGGSAGAICWFDKGNSDSMNPTTLLNPDPNLTEDEKNNWDYICIDGLGFLRGMCVPHYDVKQHNGLMRYEGSEVMVKGIMSDYPCIGIDENAAFVVNGDTLKVLEGTEGAKCYRKLYDKESDELDVMIMEEQHGAYSLSALGLLHAQV